MRGLKASTKVFDLIPLILTFSRREKGTCRFVEVGLYNIGCVRIYCARDDFFTSSEDTMPLLIKGKGEKEGRRRDRKVEE